MNDFLRQAVVDSEVTEREIAADLGVDPKTVRR